ncbi:MAG: hypothetical protein NWQ17_07070 [Polaribacter sp.]|nr:hypothetical protein [Polaribacter sp.]
MISYIKRAALDVEKYDSCIENSAQSRIYAFSWYLDIVADNWDVLVLNDYEAVMPIPWKQKFGLKYVTQPYFCQQLGIFSKEEISEEIQRQFIRKIPLKFLKINYNLNANSYGNKYTSDKKNYCLSLNEDYENSYKKFSKTRKQRVQLGIKKKLLIKNTSIHELLEIQKTFYSYEGFSSETILKLSHFLVKSKKGKFLGVYEENKLLGGGLFIHSSKRIVYLYSSFTHEGRKLQAASFLIHYVIKEHQKTNILFDFEGGNINTIEAFFKSFGAVQEIFRNYNQNILQRFF